MNGGFSSESGHRTVVFKHTCFSSGLSSKLQAYHPSAIDISYASFFFCFVNLLHANMNTVFSQCVKLHSPTDSTKESCRGDCKALVKILFDG